MEWSFFIIIPVVLFLQLIYYLMATQQECSKTKPSTPLPVENTNQTGELVYKTPDKKYLQYMNKSRCYIDIQETIQPHEI